MIGRILALAIGVLSGLTASQAPEFAQQYRQRLGGAIDELRRVVTRFDENAQASGLSRDQAISNLRANPEPLVKKQGDASQEVAERLGRLERQRQSLAAAGPFERLLVTLREADPGLARATYLDYEPAWPVTAEGFAAGGIGFLLGWVVFLLFGRTARRLTPGRRRPGPLRSA